MIQELLSDYYQGELNMKYTFHTSKMLHELFIKYVTLNSLRQSHACMCQWTWPLLVQIYLVTCRYLNQWCRIVNLTPRNKTQWNFNHISHTFIREIVFEYLIHKMAAILSKPQWVKKLATAEGPIICWLAWWLLITTSTGWCCYNTINFHPNPHKRPP